jgi:hypothetical protein
MRLKGEIGDEMLNRHRQEHGAKTPDWDGLIEG